MKILLINPKIREHSPPYNFPTGLGIIAAIMQNEGYNIHVYDENALRPSEYKIYQHLSGLKNIDVIGLGGLITVYGRLKKLIPTLREIFPKAKIVLGGGVTIEPETIFKHMEVDYCVHGEGEHTFRELCAYISGQGDNLREIAGISYVDKEKDSVVITPPRPIEKNLNQFPMPAYELFPSEIYFKNNVIKELFRIHCGTRRCATLLWSRGCPNQCTYCWRMMGKTVRFRSINLIMKEIALLRSKYGVDSYLFYDECINANPKRSIEFATQLIERGYAGPWYSHARVTNFNEVLAKLFRDSGCIGLNFGIESASRKMLLKMKKNVTIDQASKAVNIAKKANIAPVCTFIIGLPGETKTTIRESVRWIRKNKIRKYVIFFVTPYPGCELYFQPLVQQRIQNKYKTKDAFFSSLGDAQDLCINLTDFTDKQLMILRYKAIINAYGPPGLYFLGKFYKFLREFIDWKNII